SGARASRRWAMTRPSAASPTKARPSCETCGGCSLTYEACVRARVSRPRSTKRWSSAASSAARSRGVTAPPGRDERWGSWGAISGPPMSSGPVLAEGQRRVGAAEAEGVRQRRLDVLLARLVRDVVEVAVRVGRLVVDRGRQHAVIEREHRGDRLDAAGGAEEV